VACRNEFVTAQAAQRHCEMMKRGEQGMGFSQQTTTHHFRLLADGGAIEIETNDQKDTGTRDQIRQHLSHVAKMFSDGNFEIPMFIHGKTPPGVPTMSELRDQIHYDFEPTDSGGRVRIHTSNARAKRCRGAFSSAEIISLVQNSHEVCRTIMLAHGFGTPSPDRRCPAADSADPGHHDCLDDC
jgi:hypothetical protein